jgi:hypothetical protein
MKQTAVEFLVEAVNRKGLVGLFTGEELQQAKEMEKKQIIDAYETGDKYKTEISGEQYYKETFNK